MAKNSVSDWSTTPGSNSDVGGINIAEGTLAGNMNNAIREIMAQIATLNPKGATDLDADYQPLDATLTSVAALGTAANKFAYTTGVDTWAEADITAAGLALLDDADASAQRTTLGLGTAALMADSADTDLANDPDAALRRDIGKAYVDAEITEAVGTTISLGALSLGAATAAHSLGAVPEAVSWYLECTSADAGFSIGDRVYQVSFQTNADSNDAFTLWADGTNVGFSLFDSIFVATKFGAFAALTSASWTVYARAAP